MKKWLKITLIVLAIPVGIIILGLAALFIFYWMIVAISYLPPHFN